MLGERRLRVMRGIPGYLPLLGYWMLAVVVALDFTAQWSLVMFGPPLVLIASLHALSRAAHAVVGGQPDPDASVLREDLGSQGRRRPT